MQRYPDSPADERSEKRVRAFRSLLGKALYAAAWSLLTIAVPPALADPAAHQQCPVASPEQARRLGDEFFDQGDYQVAGECYEAAGQHALANRAFVKAVGPQSESASHQLSVQRDQAQDLLHRVQKAFRTKH